MKWFAMGFAMFLAAPLLAHQGMVETKDGKTYTGQVQLDTNQLIVVNAGQGLDIKIALADLLGASFRIDPALAPGVAAEEQPSTLGALPEPWQSAAVLPWNEPLAENPEMSGGSADLVFPQNLRFATVCTLFAGSVLKFVNASWQGQGLGKLWLATAQTRFLYGVFQIDTIGTNITGAADAFHFIHKPVKGDSELMARVLHVPYTTPWAKAGLMMRESLRSDSPNVFFGLKAVPGGVFQWREATGAETTVNETRTIAVPYWLKLKRTGNTFAAYCSRSGRQWRLLQTIDVPMNDDMYVGLATAGLREAHPLPSRGTTRLSFKHSSFDQVKEGPFLPSWFVPRIELQNGSMVLGRIAAADDARIAFEGGAMALEPVDTAAVAGILFQWLPSKTQALFETGRPGVILSGGEFVEGAFRGIEKGRLKLSSVLQGLRTYDLNDEVMALVLRKPMPAFQAYEIQTRDGSVWLGQQLETRNNELFLQAGSLGPRRILLYDVRSIRRLNY